MFIVGLEIVGLEADIALVQEPSVSYFPSEQTTNFISSSFVGIRQSFLPHNPLELTALVKASVLQLFLVEQFGAPNATFISV